LLPSIKPSLQHFQFCRVGLSLGILFSSILKNIDFTSAAKAKFEQSLNAISSPATVCQTPKPPLKYRFPEATDEDILQFY
jgi:hypothetical protein